MAVLDAGRLTAVTTTTATAPTSTRRNVRRRARGPRCPGVAVGPSISALHAREQLGAFGMVEPATELDEPHLEVAHVTTSSRRVSRRRSIARDSRDFTVPIGHPSASPVSASVRPAK